MTNPASGAPPRAGKKEWIGLAVLSIACLLYVMDLTVLHLAVPKLTEDLKPSSTQLLWIIDIYGFMVAGWLITMGTLGDRIGRRRLLLFGAGAFGVASVIAAFSNSSGMLIATRALLGVAGATIAPSTLSLIRNMFLDDRQRTTAVGVWITSFSLGAAVGPLLGGIVLEFFWWGAVFLLAVPVMAVLLILGPKLLPEFRDPNAGRPDVLSAAMSLTAVLAMIFGLKRIAQGGVGWLAVLAILLGLAIGILFVRRQLKLKDPLLDLRLFKASGFTASLVTYGLGGFVVFGGFLFLPQYLQLVRGLTPLEAGIWTLPWALSFVVGSNVTPKLLKWFRASHLIPGGLALAAIGVGMFTQMSSNASFVFFSIATIIFSVGLSPVFMLTTDLIMASAPPERAGAASAIAETCAEFGGALGIAVFGSIGIAVYRIAIADAIPIGLSPESADAARGTLGGALAVAGQLPGQAGATLIAAGRQAFTQGLHLVALISTVGTVCLAIFSAFLFRKVHTNTERADTNARQASGGPDSPTSH